MTPVLGTGGALVVTTAAGSCHSHSRARRAYNLPVAPSLVLSALCQTGLLLHTGPSPQVGRPLGVQAVFQSAAPRT